MLMLLLLLFYVVFARTGVPAIMVAIIGFGLNTAAHVSEIMKSALMAVDTGQVKAARTLGFSAWQAFGTLHFHKQLHLPVRCIAMPQSIFFSGRRWSDT